MKKISSKLLNLLEFNNLINALNKSHICDGALLLTSFGIIVGNIDVKLDSDDVPTLSTQVPIPCTDIVNYQKNLTVKALCNEFGDDFDLLGDGSMFAVKNAVIKYQSNTISIGEITLHSDQIIGFAPINVEDFLNQLPEHR